MVKLKEGVVLRGLMLLVVARIFGLLFNLLGLIFIRNFLGNIAKKSDI